MIAVIGILVTMLLPAVNSVREGARRAQCSGNLHQISIALGGYQSAMGKLPVGCVEPRGRRLSWNVYLLSYLDENQAWSDFDTRYPYISTQNRTATARVIPVFLCPSARTLSSYRTGSSSGDRNKNGKWDLGDDMGMTDYGGVFGTSLSQPFMNGVLVWDRALRLEEITDGLGYTLIVAEDTGRGWDADGEWANGENIFNVEVPVNASQRDEIFSDHPGGALALDCGGGVRFLTNTMDMQVLAAACTRAGGETEHRLGTQ